MATGPPACVRASSAKLVTSQRPQLDTLGKLTVQYSSFTVFCYFLMELHSHTRSVHRHEHIVVMEGTNELHKYQIKYVLYAIFEEFYFYVNLYEKY